MHHIAILVHEHDGSQTSGYFLFEIAKVWREQGFQVTVLSGPGECIDADIAILHVDLSIVSDDYLKCMDQYPVALNARVKDISKRYISDNLVTSSDDYDGAVIVKTNWNFAGIREAKLAKRRSFISRCSRFINKRILRLGRSKSTALNYKIYNSACDVPTSIWANPEYVVEKFLPERDGDLYCLRTWVFLGDKETNSICYSNEPVVKSNNIIRRELVPEVPDDLREWRRRLGFDFGKFDYAIVNRQVVLYDANRTPSLGDFSSKDVLMPGIKLLADGIRAYL